MCSFNFLSYCDNNACCIVYMYLLLLIHLLIFPMKKDWSNMKTTNGINLDRNNKYLKFLPWFTAMTSLLLKISNVSAVIFRMSQPIKRGACRLKSLLVSDIELSCLKHNNFTKHEAYTLFLTLKIIPELAMK